MPYLLQVLKQSPKVRAEAALALGEIGDPSAVPGMVEAIDPAAADRDGHEANRRLATALGALRAREAVPALQKLTASRDGFTQVAAVDALGQIGDPAGVDALAEVVRSPEAEPVTVQHALLALGRIGDPRAVPVVLRMLFEERNRVSFFPQAAFAAVELGKPMAAPLLAVLEGRDTDLEAWARKSKVMPGALYAKAAQLMGDVGGPEAVPALVSRLGYRDQDPDVAMLGSRPGGGVAGAPARRRGGEAASATSWSRSPTRTCATGTVTRWPAIGDPAALPALRAAAAGGDWDRRRAPSSRSPGSAARPRSPSSRGPGPASARRAAPRTGLPPSPA